MPRFFNFPCDEFDVQPDRVVMRNNKENDVVFPILWRPEGEYFGLLAVVAYHNTEINTWKWGKINLPNIDYPVALIDLRTGGVLHRGADKRQRRRCISEATQYMMDGMPELPVDTNISKCLHCEWYVISRNEEGIPHPPMDPCRLHGTHALRKYEGLPLRSALIMRGPSGAGKTAIVDVLLQAGDTYEACPDHFWASNGGFDPRLLGESHTFCSNAVAAAIEAERGAIIVNRTHIRHWEYWTDYCQLRKAGYTVRFLTTFPALTSQLRKARPNHPADPPYEVKRDMVKRFEPNTGNVFLDVARSIKRAYDESHNFYNNRWLLTMGVRPEMVRETTSALAMHLMEISQP